MRTEKYSRSAGILTNHSSICESRRRRLYDSPMMCEVFFDYSSPAIMSFKIENKIRADRGQSVPLCAANSFVSFEHIILTQRGTDMILVQYDRIANSLYLHPWGKIRSG